VTGTTFIDAKATRQFSAYVNAGSILNVNGTVYTGYSNFPAVKNPSAGLVRTDYLYIYTGDPLDPVGTVGSPTTLAVIYLITSGAAESGEYGVIMDYTGAVSDPVVGHSYQVKTVAHPEGESLTDPVGNGSLLPGDVVEISVAADGARTVGLPVSAAIASTSLAASDDVVAPTYVTVDGTDFYAIGPNTIIFDKRPAGDGLFLSGITPIAIYGGTPYTTAQPASAPAIAIVIG
jgi:hypothetical protein